jgi:hypothetical protein
MQNRSNKKESKADIQDFQPNHPLQRTGHAIDGFLGLSVTPS